MLVTLGLLAHALWRLWLAAVGEPGDDDDAGSLVKRLANVGRAAIYLSFLVVVAVRLLTKDEGSSGGSKEKESTSTVLGWPGGPWIVVAAGLVVIGVAGWNVRKAVTRSFADDLDPSRRLARCASGRSAASARSATWARRGVRPHRLVPHRCRPASTTRTRPGARRLRCKELTTAQLRARSCWSWSPSGLLAFGAFRILDGAAAPRRRPHPLLTRRSAQAGSNQTTASGGRVTQAEVGWPWAGGPSATTAPRLPTPEPP